MTQPDHTSSTNICSQTSSIHGGEPRVKSEGSVPDPIYLSSTYSFKNTDEIIDLLHGKIERHEYGRYSGPNQDSVEKKLAALDNTEDAVLFSSGMAAVTTLILAKVSAGDEVILFDECYHRTREFCRSHLSRFGISVVEVKTPDFSHLRQVITKKTKLIIGECPTNPHLSIVNPKELAEIGKEFGIETAIDSTLATPFNLRPCDFGVDYTIHSATKYLGGHNDLLAGNVCGAKDKLEAVRSLRGILGGVLDPGAAYRLARGLKTFSLRMTRHNENGISVANFLNNHPKVDKIWFPGLEEHRDYSIAKDCLNGFGGLITFTVKANLHGTARFIDSLKIPKIAPSLGGCESLIEQPSILSFYHHSPEARESFGIYDNMVRISCGLEESSDLIDDLRHGLEGISNEA